MSANGESGNVCVARGHHLRSGSGNGHETVWSNYCSTCHVELSPPLARRRIMDRISQIVADCDDPGWDSYGAPAITRDAADAFSALLATATGPSNAGGFAFELPLLNDGTIMFDVLPDGSVDNIYVKTPNGGEIEWDRPVGHSDGSET